jgi:hypothetical protein
MSELMQVVLLLGFSLLAIIRRDGILIWLAVVAICIGMLLEGGYSGWWLSALSIYTIAAVFGFIQSIFKFGER